LYGGYEVVFEFSNTRSISRNILSNPTEARASCGKSRVVYLVIFYLLYKQDIIVSPFGAHYYLYMKSQRLSIPDSIFFINCIVRLCATYKGCTLAKLLERCCSYIRTSASDTAKNILNSVSYWAAVWHKDSASF